MDPNNMDDLRRAGHYVRNSPQIGEVRRNSTVENLLMIILFIIAGLILAALTGKL